MRFAVPFFLLAALAAAAAPARAGAPEPIRAGSGGAAVRNLDAARLEAMLGGSFRAAVVMFVEADCPLSRNHVLTLNRLADSFARAGVAFAALAPRTAPDAPELKAFVRETGARFPVKGDPDLAWTRALGATTTPEAFLVDRSGTILYRGALDNWAASVGRKRREATEHYLRDALTLWKEGRPVAVSSVPAVGCRIE